MPIVTKTKITTKDYRTMVFFHIFLRKRSMLIFMVFAAVLSLAAIAGKLTGTIQMADWYFYVCVAFLGLIVLQYCVFEFSVRKFLASDRLMIDNERRVTISDSGIYEEGDKDKNTGEFLWNVFYHSYETKKYFYLYINTMQAIILPKRDYTPDQVNSIEKLLREKLKKNFHKR